MNGTYAINLASNVRKKNQMMCDWLLSFILDWRLFINSMRSETMIQFEIWSEKQIKNPLEYEVDLRRNSSIKFYIFYSWIYMFKMSTLFLRKILLEFYNINVDDVWYIYIWKIADWRFNMISTREITKFSSDLCLKNHTRI